MKRILIAGIGNIFMGDDAFGCEVARELLLCSLPDTVQVVDFGIRSYDLAYALTGGFGIVILVDATQRGGAHGTTYLLEIDPDELSQLELSPPDAHTLTPVGVLQMAQSLGGITAKVFLVGCEPEIFEHDNGDIGLSATVRKAVPQAVAMIKSLLRELVDAPASKNAGLVPV